jgi:ATP sulfurylase
VVFATFSTFSRYAGPREALFTALCRKNFGCSHFIVGRDHTGVGDYYDAYASHRIFDQFPDLGIIPIRFHEVYYSAKLERYVHAIEGENAQATADDKLQISGTQARQMFEQGKIPPAWFMRPEIAKIILEAVKNGEEVFV